jgi:hypothetical protein
MPPDPLAPLEHRSRRGQLDHQSGGAQKRCEEDKHESSNHQVEGSLGSLFEQRVARDGPPKGGLMHYGSDRPIESVEIPAPQHIEVA